MKAINAKSDSEKIRNRYLLTKILFFKKFSFNFTFLNYELLKLSFKIPAILCVLFLLLTQCKEDDASIFRAYVEGKFTYSDGKFLEQPIRLVVDKKIIAESFPKESGSFVLAGPYDKGVYRLQLKDFKIQSFSTDTKGCKISSDSLSIEIPDGVTYVIFNNIIIK